jgi:hypothetical protein
MSLFFTGRAEHLPQCILRPVVTNFLKEVLANSYILFQNWTVHGLYWGSYQVHKPVVLIDSMKSYRGFGRV